MVTKHKSVELMTEGGETTADKRILEEIQDSLMHLVRNALDQLPPRSLDENDDDDVDFVKRCMLRDFC